MVKRLKLLIMKIGQQKSIQAFERHTDKNLNISDVRSSKSNGKVTEVGQNFTVKLPTKIMRDSKFWKEGKVYNCTNIVEFDGIDSEIYVDDNWISDSFTTVV